MRFAQFDLACVAAPSPTLEQNAIVRGAIDHFLDCICHLDGDLNSSHVDEFQVLSIGGDCAFEQASVEDEFIVFLDCGAVEDCDHVSGPGQHECVR